MIGAGRALIAIAFLSLSVRAQDPATSSKDEARPELPKLRLICDEKSERHALRADPKNCRIGSVLPKRSFGLASETEQSPLDVCGPEGGIRIPKKDIRTDDDVQIYLSRTGGFGGPDYSVSISGNGEVLYEGKQLVRVVGKRKFKIPKADVRKILRSAKAIDFYGLCHTYDAGFTDFGSFVISITSKDGSNRVYDSGGAPRSFYEFGRVIENAARTERLVEPYWFY